MILVQFFQNEIAQTNFFSKKAAFVRIFFSKESRLRANRIGAVTNSLVTAWTTVLISGMINAQDGRAVWD